MQVVRVKRQTSRPLGLFPTVACLSSNRQPAPIDSAPDEARFPSHRTQRSCPATSSCPQSAVLRRRSVDHHADVTHAGRSGFLQHVSNDHLEPVVPDARRLGTAARRQRRAAPTVLWRTGRIYTIAITCTDAAGNSTRKTVTVRRRLCWPKITVVLTIWLPARCQQRACNLMCDWASRPPFSRWRSRPQPLRPWPILNREPMSSRVSCLMPTARVERRLRN